MEGVPAAPVTLDSDYTLGPEAVSVRERYLSAESDICGATGDIGLVPIQHDDESALGD